MIEQAGRCLCGDVRFRLTGAPYEVDYCHCHSCRKHTGAPVVVFADCKAGVVEFTQGAPTFYQSSPGVRRGFCARCGSTLTYESDSLPGEVHVHIGAHGSAGGLSATWQVDVSGAASCVVPDRGGGWRLAAPAPDDMLSAVARIPDAGNSTAAAFNQLALPRDVLRVSKHKLNGTATVSRLGSAPVPFRRRPRRNLAPCGSFTKYLLMRVGCSALYLPQQRPSSIQES